MLLGSRLNIGRSTESPRSHFRCRQLGHSLIRRLSGDVNFFAQFRHDTVCGLSAMSRNGFFSEDISEIVASPPENRYR